VVLVEKHELPLVAIELFFHGGASTVDPAAAGLASLTVDMLDEGAGGRGALELAAELERLGTALHSAAGYDASHVEVLSLRPRLGETLDLLADVVTRPSFPEHEVERVRRRRIDLSLELLAEPRSVANDVLARVLYGPEHPWGPPLLGTRAALARLERADVVTYHERHHHAGNATIVVAGDVTRAELERMLAERLGGWEPGEAVALTLPPAPELDRARIWLIDRPDAGQSELRVGRVAAARDAEDYFAVVVLNTVLGGAFTSGINAKLWV
jgi:zinc protease